MRIVLILAVTFAMAPLGARAADLVVWWEKGQAAEENEGSGRSLPPSRRTPASRSNSSLVSRKHL
jgi:hypothetical protein